MDDALPFGSRLYLWMLLLVIFSRGMDFLSTWIATPGLVLEGNPLAKKLGWKFGGVVNVILCFIFAFWPMTAIIVSTTSVLVAARNFQNAWMMRSLGEEEYRDWFVERLQLANLPLYFFCLISQTWLTAAVGAALMFFSEMLVPFSIGLGIIAYSVTVLFYTALSVWRIRRAMG
jgi:hypothetical protein